MTDNATYTTPDGHVIKLVPPTSQPEIAAEVVFLSATNTLRASCMALAVCWVGPGRPSQTYRATGFNPAVFGGQISKELMGTRKWPWGATMELAQAALLACNSVLPDEVEVAEVEGFCEAKEDGSG